MMKMMIPVNIILDVHAVASIFPQRLDVFVGREFHCITINSLTLHEFNRRKNQD